jgi:flagellar basal body P-ring formation protein FlgA
MVTPEHGSTKWVAKQGTPLALVVSLIFSASTHAQPAGTLQQGERADVSIQRFLDRELATATQLGQLPEPNVSRVEVNVGQIDSRLQLAPCARVEPYLSNGARLWGRINVMLRCVEGANWNVALPVTVRVFGQAFISSRAISANAQIREADIQLQEVELSREPGMPLTSYDQLEQKVLSRPVSAGTVLRQDWFRALPVISAGDQVRVVASGVGFSLTSEGQALNQASEGQVVRVKTDAGRVVSATARMSRSGPVAEIRF